jgi:signal transduction histidine kinase/CheY-like chemotaxis protein
MSWGIIVTISCLCVAALTGGLVALALRRRADRLPNRAGAALSGPGRVPEPVTPRSAADAAAARDTTPAETALADLERRSLLLQGADRQRNQLMAKMSHDLRTPLNSVITLSQLLFEGNAGPLAFEQRKYLEVIHRSGRGLLALINDILDLSHLEGGQLEIDLSPIDVRAVIRGVGQASQELGRKKGLPLHLNPPRRAVFAQADEERLRQVLLHLIEHAISRTANGYVELSVDRDDPEVSIRISDTGPGASRPLHQAPFDEFLTAAFAVEGPSLGLILAGKLIRLMNGQIAVDSAPGEGTTFLVTLPRASDARADGRDEAVPAPLEPTTGSVLLIEDDDLERRRVAGLLEETGYDVTLASSGQEGLNLLHDGQFDAVVLDLVMPGMSGLDVLRAARVDERLSSTPFVVLSALYMTKSEREVLGPSVAAVIRKGERIGDELALQLGRALRESRRGGRPSSSAVSRPIEADGHAARVLIIEPDDDSLFTLEQELAALPVRIDTATTGEQAIEICRRHRPDLVIMGAELPGVSGEAGRGIHQLPDCANVPIIGISAVARYGADQRGLADRCSEVLAKPVKPGDVASAVTRALQLGGDVH